MSNFIKGKTTMPDGTEIQLEDWSNEFPSSTNLWWAVGAYPVAKHSSGRLFGPRRNQEFRLTISFAEESDARECFRKLESGEAELLDYRDKFWNGERDAEILEV